MTWATRPGAQVGPPARLMWGVLGVMGVTSAMGAVACAADTREIDLLCEIATHMATSTEEPVEGRGTGAGSARLASWGERAMASVSSPAVRRAIEKTLAALPTDRWATLQRAAGDLGRDAFVCPALAQLFDDARREAVRTPR